MIRIRALRPFVFNWRGGRIYMDKGEVREVDSEAVQNPWLREQAEILPEPFSDPKPVASLPRTESTEELKPVRRRGRRPKNANSSNG